MIMTRLLRLWGAFALTALLVMLTACAGFGPDASPQTSAPPSQQTAPPTGTSEPGPESGEPSVTPTTPASRAPLAHYEATLIAVGDIMAHMPQLPAYYDTKRKRYNFDAWFERVKPIFAQGDWVVGNLEAPLAGQDLKYSGFPRFNAPAELAEALVNAGVQLVSTANNHSMDRGFPGIERTLDNVRAAGLTPFGTAASVEEARRSVIAERNGIRLGFLAYTYGTNGIPVPESKPFAVNHIDIDAIREDIARLRRDGADAVSVSLHFGTEYQRLPNEIQTSLARDVVAAGADIVLGSHPHVVQPYEEVVVPAADSIDGTERRGIVIYSLGNFISNQKNDWKDVGLIFGVTLIKTEQEDGTFETRWADVATTPTWVHILTKNNKRYYTIIPMKEALESRDIPNLTAQDYTKMEKLLKGIDAHLLHFQHR